MHARLAAALAGVALLPAPVAAQEVVVLTCFVSYQFAGGQRWSATADCNVIGTSAGSVVIYADVTASGALCSPTGEMNGQITGAINVDFSLTRVSAAGVVTTSGDITGAGVAAFSSPCVPALGGESMVLTLGGV